MADEGQQIVPTQPDVDRDTFVETFNVREKGRRYEVAANAIANRAMMQVNVAKLRVLAERAMKPFFDNPNAEIDPKELKTLVEGVQMIDEMSDRAYSASKGDGNLANALERLVFAAAKGGAQGANHVGGNSPDARLRRLKNLVGKAKPVEIEPMEIVE
jgi:hypothetical protein